MGNSISTESISSINISGMDLETALMAVQSNRANLLENQLKDQIASVQLKNDKVAKLNEAMTYLNQVSALHKSGSDETLNLTPELQTINKNYDDSAKVAGIGGALIFGGGAKSKMIHDYKKSEIDSAITSIKSNIDTMSNTQQMDMLRLQSLSNKRNEAFEMMTNFIKKVQDGLSSILRNIS